MLLTGMGKDMPGENHEGPLPPLSSSQAKLTAELQADVTHLAGEIGERHTLLPDALHAAEHWLHEELSQIDGASVKRMAFTADNCEVANLELSLPGSIDEQVLVIGAHYDSAIGTPGANDNGTAVAACLALARRMTSVSSDHTIRIVLFVNEEPPYFQTDAMGSLVYARACEAAGDRIMGMLSLETMGYYSDQPHSQSYPPPMNWFYPDAGNFIAFVSNWQSQAFLKHSVRLFRQHAAFPSQGCALPGWFPGIGWSDHWSFWQAGFPACMLTDTAPYRYPYYHDAEDTPDKIDYEGLARVVDGLHGTIKGLSTEESSNPNAGEDE